MAVTGTPIAGYEGRVEINGTVVKLEKWSVTPQAQDIKTTNFESGGFDEGITGIRSADIEFSGFWDAASNPHSNPPGFQAGDILTNVYLYVRVTGNRRFTFPKMRVISVPVQNSVEGRVELSVRGKSDGPFTYPS